MGIIHQMGRTAMNLTEKYQEELANIFVEEMGYSKEGALILIRGQVQRDIAWIKFIAQVIIPEAYTNAEKAIKPKGFLDMIDLESFTKTVIE